MRLLIRLFFRSIRLVVGPILLLLEKLTSPKGTERSPEQQRHIDTLTDNLILYQFRTCPFCMKVRREIKRQSLNIELRDAQYNQHYRQELLQGGGQVKVPCLSIRAQNGELTWMYESDDVIQYLRNLVAGVPA